jgi:hypothetical protein
VNWLVFIHIPQLSTNSFLFIHVGRTLEGTHITAVGLYFLKTGDCRMYEFSYHYLTVISNIFIRELTSKVHSIVFHYPLCRTKSHINRQCYVTNALSLQVFFPHASADCWLQQSCCTWPATIRRYGLQPTVCDQIIPHVNWYQNFGGLLSVRHLCSRLWQYHSSSYHKDNTCIGEEVWIMCSCK